MNLNKSIDFTLDSIQNYCNDPVSNFTRNRKLPAHTLIQCILNFSNYSTLSEISQFFLMLRICLLLLLFVNAENYWILISLNVSIVYFYPVLIISLPLMVIVYWLKMVLSLTSHLRMMIPGLDTIVLAFPAVSIISMLYMIV